MGMPDDIAGIVCWGRFRRARADMIKELTELKKDPWTIMAVLNLHGAVHVEQIANGIDDHAVPIDYGPERCRVKEQEIGMVDGKECTRITRTIRIGGKSHRLTIVLESDRPEGRYTVDDVVVSTTEFDRIVALGMVPE